MNLGCGNCGRNNPPGARFCLYCGSELAMPVEEPTAASDPALPELTTTVTLVPLMTGPADKVGIWQRIVLGLAALLLLGLSWLGVVAFLSGLSVVGVVLLLLAVGFGYATVRPPGGILRRLLVALGCLVIFSVAGAVIAAIAFFIWFFQGFG